MAKDSSVLLQEAMVMHQRGALHDAATRYSQVLRSEPKNVDVRCFLGMALAQQRQFAEAAHQFRRAVKIAPAHAPAHEMLGLALAQLDRANDALESFERAIEHLPYSPSAYLHRANLLRTLGRIAEALADYDHSLAIDAASFEAWGNRGLALDGLHRHEEAIASYDRALALQSNSAEVHINRGNVLAKLRRHEEAIASFDLALAARPAFPEAWVNRGNSLRELNRPEQALIAYERALALRNDMAEAEFNRGITLTALGRFTDAVDSFDRASRTPLFERDQLRRAHLHCYRASALHLLGRYQDVFAEVEEALRLAPNDDEVLYMVASFELSHGRWREAWPKYERRPAVEQGADRNFDLRHVARWTGERLQDELLVIRCEFGSGDRLQFACFAAHLAKLGMRVALLNDSGLSPLLATIPSIEKVFSDPRELDGAGPIRWVSMMSLPHLLAIIPETLPNVVPFLSADPARVAAWRTRLGSAGFKVGIVWQGNPDYAQDRHRSIPLTAFAPLAEIPGVRLISLQKGFGSEQIGQVPFGHRIETLGDDFDEGPAFLDSAAVMIHLDLIIGSSTSAVQLAGALGRPLFVALNAAPDWRWLLDRDDCPWYPTARLFRQTALGDWPGVFTRIADAVRTLARAD
jgi:tetratricopeptide (TPR) repeat protein